MPEQEEQEQEQEQNQNMRNRKVMNQNLFHQFIQLLVIPILL